MLLPLLLLLANADAEPFPTAPVGLPGEARASALHHLDFRKHAAAGAGEEALTEYNGLLARPFDLAPLSQRHSLQARWLAHRDFSLLAPELRARLRDQREPVARQLLEAARAPLDEPRLRQIVEEQFGTATAMKAIDILGDLAFDRGDFDTAGCWYRLLLPAARDGLAVPDAPGDPGRVRAKLLLARIFAGKRLGAGAALAPALQADLTAFARSHPDTAGPLAGRTGKYHETLLALAQDRNLEAPSGSGWPTFGGSARRQMALPGNETLVDHFAAMTRRAFMRLNLETRKPGPGERFVEPSFKWNNGMAIYPALADDTLYFADSRYLTTIDLKTGGVRELFDASKAVPGLDPERTFPMPDHFRASVTISGDHILSRHGVVGLLDARSNPGRNANTDSVLVCLKRSTDGAARVLWRARGSVPEGAMFEGTPLVSQGRVYIGATRVQAERTTTAIHCYALESRGDAQPLWVRDVCETRELCGGPVRRLHHLLTLAGPVVVYASHSGAIVALDAVTGQRVWAVRYPGRPRENRNPLPGSEGQPGLYDLAPPLFAEGAVYVAPNDSETLFCLDPWTGTTLWQREGIQAVHLLGTYRDLLIFTTADGLRAVNARDGTDRWTLPDAGRLPPLGRGQLVGELVLWSTVRGVVAIRAEDGRVPDGPARLERVPPGNLVYADGVLAVADRTTLTVFRAEKLQPQVRAEARDWRALVDDPGTLRDEHRRPWPAAALARRELAKQGEKTAPAKTPPATVAKVPRSPLPREWTLGTTVELESGERLIPGSALFLTSQPCNRGSVLRLRDDDSARPVWRTELAFTPTWSAALDSLLLLGGPDGLAGVGHAGTCLWQVNSDEGFDAMQHAGDRLFVRVGRQRLRAVASTTGAILWEFATPDAGLPLPSPLGDLGPGYLATDSRVWVRSPGRRHLLEAATGKVLRQEPAGAALDADDRVRLDSGRELIVAERLAIERIDLTTGASVWSWPIPGATTFRQEPVRLATVGEALWVQVPVNIGHVVYRIDQRTGKPLDDEPRLIQAEPFDLSAVRVRGDTVFAIEPPEVVARRVPDGAIRWRQPLPAGPARYRLEPVEDEVLIMPAACRVEGTEFRCLIGTLEWMMKYPPGGAVLRLDAATGKPRRIVVPMELPTLAWNWRPGLQQYLRPEGRPLRRAEPASVALLSGPDGWRLIQGPRTWQVK